MPEELFQRLRKQIDQYSVGFPATKSGVEIAILKRLFLEEEALLYLSLSMQLESPEAFSNRTGRELAAVENQLETMAKKGLLFRKRKAGGPVLYAAIPFIVGIFEFQVKTMDKELAVLMEHYFKEAYSRNMADFIPVMRTIPVNRSVDIRHNVASFLDARKIVRSKKMIAVANCICRSHKTLLNDACDKPIEVCMLFGSHAEYYVENKMARIIDQEEALKILDQCEAAGLVNQPANMINPGGMCNCCGDCCGVLRSLKCLPNPAEKVANHFQAVVDPALCTGCEICVDRCQMDAVVVNDNQVAIINRDRCIGCGLCVTTCPTGAAALLLKPEASRPSVPENGLALMMKNATLRGKSLVPLSMMET